MKATNDKTVILHNGTFWQGKQAKPIKGWIAIQNDKITNFVQGKLPDSIEAEKIIDLNQSHVLPGFVDCHTHLTISAWIPCTVDGSNWASKLDMLNTLRSHARTLKQEAWIVVFYADFFKIGKLPSMDELNEAVGGRPIVINDFSLHKCLANDNAFKQANVSLKTFNSCDIEFKNGKPTGLLREMASGQMLSTGLRNFAEQFENLNITSLLEAEARRHISLGITACHDPIVHPIMQEAMEKLEKITPIKLSWSHVKSHEQAEFVSEDLCLSCGTGPKSAKLFLDGADQCAICLNPMDVMNMSMRSITQAFTGNFSSLHTLTNQKMNYKSGQFKSPYLKIDQKALGRSLDELSNQGVRPKIHALGNEAVKCACKALKNSGVKNATVEHLVLVSDDNIEDVAECGAVASLQPGFLQQAEELETSELDKVFNVIPAKSLLNADIPVALSSDSPCGPLNPLGNIRLAVDRISGNGIIIDKKERLTTSEAIAAYSMGGHHAIHNSPHGGIAIGESADLAILNGHPDNSFAQVISTWIDGKEEYSTGMLK